MKLYIFEQNNVKIAAYANSYEESLKVANESVKEQYISDKTKFYVNDSVTLYDGFIMLVEDKFCPIRKMFTSAKGYYLDKNNKEIYLSFNADKQLCDSAIRDINTKVLDLIDELSKNDRGEIAASLHSKKRHRIMIYADSRADAKIVFDDVAVFCEMF